MKNRRLTIFAFVAGAFLVGLLTTGPPTAMAQTDPQEFVCATCSMPAGGDPNLITNTGAFNVGVAGAGITMQSPTLIIVGVYGGTSSTTAPQVSFNSTNYNPGGVGDWGVTTDKTGLASGQDAYVQVGIADPNGGNSETFGNWSTGDTKNGFAAPTSFELFVYQIPTGLVGNTPVSIDLTGAPNGSYVIAYSCKVGGTLPSGGACTDGDVGSTPVTNAGLVDNTAPEASTVSLASLVLLAFGALALQARRSERA